MWLKKALLVIVAVVSIGLIGFAAWIARLPLDVANGTAPPVPSVEMEAIHAALAPRSAGRPLITIVGLNDATETTDYLLPASILRRADIADVVMLAAGPGPVQLFPALKVEADATLAAFDAEHPQGADYVVVPAMNRDDDPVVIDWLQMQSAKGAIIIGICAGAKVVAAAGLLDGKRATTHWYYVDEMLRRSPSIRHVADRRMVADDRVVTTTGISASIPMMLTLIEAIGGRNRAKEVAQDLGISSWSAEHSSAAFGLTRHFVRTILQNSLTFWRRETFTIPLQPDMDEASLAFMADGWSRTYRSQVRTYAMTPSAVASANGIRLLPDELAAGRQLMIQPGLRSADALDNMLASISERYGAATRDVVAMQLEYRPGVLTR